MKITVTTNSHEISDLFTKKSIEGINIECKYPPLQRTISCDQLILITITVVSTIPANVLSAWIIEKIHNSKSKIFINDKEVEVEKKALTEEIKKNLDK